jgi:DNA-binding MarR family transcriptional regulator
MNENIGFVLDDVFVDETLPPMAKLMLIFLLRHGIVEQGFLYIKNRDLSEEFDVSGHTVTEYLKKLINAGYIKRSREQLKGVKGLRTCLKWVYEA